MASIDANNSAFPDCSSKLGRTAALVPVWAASAHAGNPINFTLSRSRRECPITAAKKCELPRILRGPGLGDRIMIGRAV